MVKNSFVTCLYIKENKEMPYSVRRNSRLTTLQHFLNIFKMKMFKASKSSLMKN